MPQVGSCLTSLCTSSLQNCTTAGSLQIGDATLHQPAKPRFAARLTLGRVGSFLARQAGQARLGQPVKHTTGQTSICAAVIKLDSAKKTHAPDFLSLPEDILINIVSRLNDRHRCRVELASNRL